MRVAPPIGVMSMIAQTLNGTWLITLCTFLSAAWPMHGCATTFSVGSGAGCTHATVQAAINAAVIDASAGPHLIKLVSGTISVPNGLTLHNAVADIAIEGGYVSCTGTQGSASRTVLDAAGGADGTVLDIRYFGATGSRSVRLRRLDITGGTGETGPLSSSEGGGLELRGNLEVFLEQATHVRDNHAYRAGGVLMQGGPGLVTLTLSDQSSLNGNIADTDGGGVWCYNRGIVYLNDASVDFNEAGRDGGGIFLGTQCALIAGNPFSAPGTIVLLDNNAAGTVYGGRGGAVFYQSTQTISSPFDLDFQGTPANPILLINNRALCNATPCASATGEGGALYLEGLTAESSPLSVKDTTFYSNSAGLWGSAISLRRAVHLTLVGSASRCNGSVGFGLCSAVVGGDTTAIEMFDNVSTSAAMAPKLNIRRTRFTGNGGRNVIDAFAWYNVAASLAVTDSVIDHNTVGAVVDTDLSWALRYSTVVGNTLTAGTSGVFGWYPRTGTDTGALTLDGSIVWQPGATVMYSPADPSRYQASHFGCLLVNNLAGVSNPAPVRTTDPQLDANFVPGPTSPALDVCNGGPDTTLDAYGTHRPQDQPGIPNALGAYDLGAVERPLSDLIFASGFQ